MIRIKQASLDDIPLIHDLAEQTWWPAYSSILSPEQIRYMLDKIYSTKALLQCMESGAQKFLLAWGDSKCHGFASYGRRPSDPRVFKLHKLYVLPDNHRKGYGRALVDEVCSRVLHERGVALELNVNRYNRAKSFYERIGFRVLYEEDIPIGPYWMNDYVMRRDLVTGETST